MAGVYALLLLLTLSTILNNSKTDKLVRINFSESHKGQTEQVFVHFIISSE